MSDLISKYSFSETVMPAYQAYDSSENGIRIVVDVEDLAMDDLQVSMQGQHLVVTGENDTLRLRNQYGIDSSFRDAPIGATLKDGLLTITIGEPEPEAPKRAIQIKQG